ncbi:MAG: isoquinoline 1-oxidoreductase, partial [Rhodobacteraceae bacterium]|nr:isoquinoline 1-oxidoreductase [Paracoccaceae bacterium]
MSRTGTIARRSLLIGSAAIVGGVAFGVVKLNQPPANPLDPAPGQAALNPFIFIDRDGVTIITPKAEMGQGVQTSLAAMAAEELDLDWEQVRVLHGPPAAAYYNSTVMAGALPFREYDMGGLQHALAEQVGKLGRVIGLQITGGVSVIGGRVVRRRDAGASARETLKLAAAERLGVAAASLVTRHGQVIAPDGTAIPYGDLAEAAAAIDPPRVAPRDPSDWRYLGTSMPRLDQV